MEQRKKNNLTDLLMIHGAVLLFGLAGVISKGITTGSMMITFGRVFFSSITLYILCMATRTSIKLKSKSDFMWLVITGAVLALHWFSFIESVRVASVAVGTITFSTFPLFFYRARNVQGKAKAEKRHMRDRHADRRIRAGSPG